ncbi:uncharacterized protein N7482_006269 [Penicillium canariense]|uniref:Major facilitator superfamily (MFS) profile domain-containing protein n=1 Tax=Penicillium canariense TaxID=189055 RepID=A0A9W9I652_9EURO|nr:uncharacterized protein N7482_006269 [Penicillium canariense]KAJ5167488.1 hypothetical protein N7482_006269 [Penicillium canariense]
MVLQYADNGESQPLLADVPKGAITNRSKSKKLMMLLICGIIVLAVDFGNNMAIAPQTAIFEQIICRNHGARSSSGAGAPSNGPSNGDPCKSEAVQGELALVLGYKDMFEVLPGILLSLPYGVLADHWGRKPVVYLGMAGMLLGEVWVRLVALWANVLPLRLVWLTGLFRVIGGGDKVIVSIVLVMVADIFSEEERSTALFSLQSCIILSDIVGAPIGAWLMQHDLWVPYILGVVIMIVGSTPLLFLQETLEEAKASKAKSRHAPGTDAADISDDSSGRVEPAGKQPALQELIREAREFKESTRFIWQNWSVCLVILCMLVTEISRQSTGVLLQYASKKFIWTIARASLLVSLRGVFSLANYLIIMPVVSFLAANYLNLHGKHRDHRLSQGSGLVSVIGFMAIGLAPVPALLICGLVILSLGSAFDITLRSLATGLVPPDLVGTLYSAIAISQSLGVLIAGPLFAYLFRAGLHFGGTWMGLPFLQAGLFYAIATIAVGYIRVPPAAPDDSDGEEPLFS